MATKKPDGGSLLRDWREQQDLTGLELSRLLQCTQARVSQIENGEAPSLKLALRIEAVTGGAIPVQVWHQLAEKGAA